MKYLTTLLFYYPMSCLISIPGAVIAAMGTFLELAYGKNYDAVLEFEIAMQERYGAKVISLWSGSEGSESTEDLEREERYSFQGELIGAF